MLTGWNWNETDEKDDGGGGGDPANRLQLSRHLLDRVCKSRFGFEKVLVNYDWSQECVYGVDHEIEMNELIDGHDLAPKFLAHITETNDSDEDNPNATSKRVIGLMVEKLSAARKPTLEDLPEALCKLHKLGIACAPPQKISSYSPPPPPPPPPSTNPISAKPQPRPPPLFSNTLPVPKRHPTKSSWRRSWTISSPPPTKQEEQQQHHRSSKHHYPLPESGRRDPRHLPPRRRPTSPRHRTGQNRTNHHHHGGA